MKRKIIIPALLLALFASGTNAGVYGTTIHSRANCINNESITWYLWNSYNWRVISFHNYDLNQPSKGNHVIDTGWSVTWRQAAVHWRESYPGGTYFVSGFHYFIYRNHEVLDGNTQTSDCSIYDGWWDYNDFNYNEGK